MIPNAGLWIQDKALQGNANDPLRMMSRTAATLVSLFRIPKTSVSRKFQCSLMGDTAMDARYARSVLGSCFCKKPRLFSRQWQGDLELKDLVEDAMFAPGVSQEIAADISEHLSSRPDILGISGQFIIHTLLEETSTGLQIKENHFIVACLVYRLCNYRKLCEVLEDLFKFLHNECQDRWIFAMKYHTWVFSDNEDLSCVSEAVRKGEILLPKGLLSSLAAFTDLPAWALLSEFPGHLGFLQHAITQFLDAHLPLFDYVYQNVFIRDFASNEDSSLVDPYACKETHTISAVGLLGPDPTRNVTFEDLPDFTRFSPNHTLWRDNKLQPDDVVKVIELFWFYKTQLLRCVNRNFIAKLLDYLEEYPILITLFRVVLRVSLLGAYPHVMKKPLSFQVRFQIYKFFDVSQTTNDEFMEWLSSHRVIVELILREASIFYTCFSGIPDEINHEVSGEPWRLVKGSNAFGCNFLRETLVKNGLTATAWILCETYGQSLHRIDLKNYVPKPKKSKIDTIIAWITEKYYGNTLRELGYSDAEGYLDIAIKTKLPEELLSQTIPELAKIAVGAVSDIPGNCLLGVPLEFLALLPEEQLHERCLANFIRTKQILQGTLELPGKLLKCTLDHCNSHCELVLISFLRALQKFQLNQGVLLSENVAVTQVLPIFRKNKSRPTHGFSIDPDYVPDTLFCQEKNHPVFVEIHSNKRGGCASGLIRRAIKPCYNSQTDQLECKKCPGSLPLEKRDITGKLTCHANRFWGLCCVCGAYTQVDPINFSDGYVRCLMHVNLPLANMNIAVPTTGDPFKDLATEAKRINEILLQYRKQLSTGEVVLSEIQQVREKPVVKKQPSLKKIRKLASGQAKIEPKTESLDPVMGKTEREMEMYADMLRNFELESLGPDELSLPAKGTPVESKKEFKKPRVSIKKEPEVHSTPTQEKSTGPPVCLFCEAEVSDNLSLFHRVAVIENGTRTMKTLCETHASLAQSDIELNKRTYTVNQFKEIMQKRLSNRKIVNGTRIYFK